MISYPRDRVQNILVRLIDASTGKLLQEIEPEGLSRENWIPSMVGESGARKKCQTSWAHLFSIQSIDSIGACPILPGQEILVG